MQVTKYEDQILLNEQLVPFINGIFICFVLI